MSKKIKSAELVNKFINLFKCPVCGDTMSVVEHKSLKCPKNHTFDFTKQGYINLMTRPSNSHYKKELFEARHNIIIESKIYDPMHEAINKAIKVHLGVSVSPFMIADLGCGEGSHLQRILEGMRPVATGVGLDISKEGIALAAKKYDDPIWLVADLANSPLEDESCHIILNILSPSNYKEFIRMLLPNGLIIKVVPRSNYLKELRNAFFDDKEKKEYQNDEIVSLFKKHFQLLDVSSLSYTKILNKAELENLVQMTPLAWTAEKRSIEQFINRDSAQITVDLDILVGQNKA